MRLFAAGVFLIGSSFGSPHLLAQTGDDVPLAFADVTVIDVSEGWALSEAERVRGRLDAD